MVAALDGCTVRIRAADGRVVGAGFLVTVDLIATCAHVVRSALGLRDGAVPPIGAVLSLDLPRLDGSPTVSGRVEWCDVSADLAVLSIKPVAGATTAPVVRTNELTEHPFSAFGFPPGFDGGVYTSGTVMGRRAEGQYHLQAKEAHGFRVVGGFSGGPVWDEQLGAVVGMVISSVEGKGAEDLRAAFMVPIARWVDARPEWSALAPEVQTAEDTIRAAEAKYLRDLAGEYLYLKFRGIEQAEKWQSLPLDQVFIDLRAFPESEAGSGSEATVAFVSHRRRLEEARPEERNSLAEELLAEELQHESGTREKTQPAPVARFLIEPGAVVILGGPGSGKTTLVKRLARSFALGALEAQTRYPDLPWCFPVPVAAAVFSSSREGRSLLTFLRDKIKEKGGAPLLAVLDKYWGDGKCIVLIDGLDEIADAGERVACAGEVDRLLAMSAGNRVVVSSRPVGYRLCRLAAPAGIRLAHVQLVPLSSDDVEAFAHRWYEAYEQAAHREHPDLVQARIDAKALVGEIRSNSQVADLTRNPLMLTIVALIKHQQITLPDRCVRLYETVLDTLINSWNKARNLEGMPLGVQLSLEDTKKVWGAVAYWMHTRNTGTVTRVRLLEQLVSVIEKLSGDELGATQAAEGYIKVASEGVGLLEARGANAFAFLHQTFQEYLAARHLTRSSTKAIAEITAVCHDPRWHEVVRLAAGYIGVIREDEDLVTDLVRGLAQHEAGPLGRSLLIGLRLAAACLADDVRTSSVIVDDILCMLYIGYEDITCLPVRFAIADSISSIKAIAPSERTAAVIERCLVAEDWRIRMNSARFLGRLLVRRPELVSLFWTRLREDHDVDVRAWLAWGIFESQVGPSVETAEVFSSLVWAARNLWTGNLRQIILTQRARLLRIIIETKDDVVRLSIAELLVEWGPQEQVVSALASLLGSLDSVARYSVTQALRRWDPQPQVVPILLGHLGNADASVRYFGLQILQAWGLQEEAIPALLALLTNAEVGVRITAAQVLVAWGPQERVVAALVALLGNLDDTVRSSVVQVLREWGKEEITVNVLADILYDCNEFVRSSAAVELGGWRVQEKLISSLDGLLVDSSSRVRLSAASTLGRWGLKERVSPVLCALLGVQEDHVRVSAAELLSRWGRRDLAAPVLVELLKSDNVGTRLSAARALTPWGEKEKVIHAMVSLFADVNSNVRFAAAHALIDWDASEYAVKYLIDLLGDEDPSMRYCGSEVLKRWGVQLAAIPSLVAMLNDADSTSRSHAVEVLQRWGGHASTATTLVANLANSTGVVQASIAEVLGSWGPQEHEMKTLVALLSHSDDGVRSAVARVLREWGASVVFRFVLPLVTCIDGCGVVDELLNCDSGKKVILSNETMRYLANIVLVASGDSEQMRTLKDLLLAATWDVAVGDGR